MRLGMTSAAIESFEKGLPSMIVGTFSKPSAATVKPSLWTQQMWMLTSTWVRTHKSMKHRFSSSAMIVFSLVMISRNMYGNFTSFSSGLALQQLGHVKEAASTYHEVMEFDDTHFPTYYNLGLLHLEEGDAVHALRLLQRALELNSQDADLFILLGTAYRGVDDLDSALSSFRRALEIEPSPMAYHNAGSTLMDMGRPEDAAAIFHHVIEMEPGFLDSYYCLGLVYQELGAEEEAMYYLQEAEKMMDERKTGVRNGYFKSYPIFSSFLSGCKKWFGVFLPGMSHGVVLAPDAFLASRMMNCDVAASMQKLC